MDTNEMQLMHCFHACFTAELLLFYSSAFGCLAALLFPRKGARLDVKMNDGFDERWFFVLVVVIVE